ncbi:DUF3086 domain-containing protein [Prochlorococcus sp. MIT 1307]|uniref:DUF3086 domain-containing protein n=1 Tax=Prochlorococcus sp. MIT 1307 TaxID=3096219 RepID=UPI002A74929A|nr:DUF3086 domain-containing protein [Prochlorococcus sp. MIT 1307]
MSEQNSSPKETNKAEQPAEIQTPLESPVINTPSNPANQAQNETINIPNNKANFAPLIEIALKEIESRRNELVKEIEVLAKRKSNLEEELQTTFTGQSDAIARRVKGFQDYLTGALQGLAQSAEKLDLVVQPVVLQPSPLDKKESEEINETSAKVDAIANTFQPDENLIRECLEQFLGQPDFYADPWKLRRSLDSKDIELLEDWFFNMGGRGAQPSRGSRPKNVLISAGLISILGELYGDRFQTLVLASQPERLGEWRRGLQDALGLEREDFGPNSGIVLFERSNGVLERADRLEERGEVPLILIDAAEQSVEIPILQFPLWLAFAAEPEELYKEEELL